MAAASPAPCARLTGQAVNPSRVVHCCQGLSRPLHPPAWRSIGSLRAIPAGMPRPGGRSRVRQGGSGAARRCALRCTAHGSHGHSCGHTHSQDTLSSSDSCSASTSGEEDEAAATVGHTHGPSADLSNAAHRALKGVYDATRLTQLAAWAEDSPIASVAKVALFAVAALAAVFASGQGVQAGAAARWVSVAATAGVYLLAGPPALVDTTYDVTAGRVDTHLLMNLAVLGTLVTGHALEGALLLVLFQTSHVVEHLLTDRAQGSLRSLYDSIPKDATTVKLQADESPDMGSAMRVQAADVVVGECMLVKPGEQVPLDGVIVHGRALVSAEHITGESLPSLKRPGDEVAAGSLNRDGLLVLRVTRLVSESTPARIARLAMDAQAKRPQLRTWLDSFGELYSKGVIAASLGMLAVLLAAGVPLLGTAGQRGAFYRAMGLLTVASPCALVMVPLAYVSAIAAIASRGIIIKGGRVLDALASCRTVAFDKTGTLTTGALVCTAMRPLAAAAASGAAARGVGGREGAAAKKAALEAVVALSLRSSHPVSDAVVLLGEDGGVDGSAAAVSEFQLVAGGGVEGVVSVAPAASTSGRGVLSTAAASAARGAAPREQHAAFGSADFVSGRLSAEEGAVVAQLQAAQGTAAVLSVLVLEPVGPPPSPFASPDAAAERSVWVLTFEDSVRKQSSAAVRSLQTGSWTGGASNASKVDVLMLTGDNDSSARRVARKLGITRVLAGLSPEQKLEQVATLSSHSSGSSGDNGAAAAPAGRQRRSAKQWQGSGRGVVMVGDGINDAPALAAADVGVAIAGSAAAAASLAADVIVMSSGGIAAVPYLLAVARATQAVVRQNLVLAVGSIVALALPTVLGVVPLWLAVMLHEGSTLLVALNSLRLLRFGAAPDSKEAHSGSRAGAFGSSRTPGKRAAKPAEQQPALA